MPRWLGKCCICLFINDTGKINSVIISVAKPLFYREFIDPDVSIYTCGVILCNLVFVSKSLKSNMTTLTNDALLAIIQGHSEVV